MIDIGMVIFSKDRAMQLDLLLRSIKANAQSFSNKATVVYLATSYDSSRCYQHVINKHSDFFSFMRESDFASNVIEVVERAENQYILFNSDDNVFIGKMPNIVETDFADDICAISLRLHPGVNVCQPASLDIKPPQMAIGPDTETITWDWTEFDPRGCWGYPHAIDSNVYRKDEILPVLKSGDFHNPTGAEIHLNNNRPSKTKMLCYVKPTIVNIPANIVSGNSANPVKGPTTKELDQLYLDGLQIKDVRIKENLNACHVYIPFEYEERI